MWFTTELTRNDWHFRNLSLFQGGIVESNKVRCLCPTKKCYISSIDWARNKSGPCWRAARFRKIGTCVPPCDGLLRKTVRRHGRNRATRESQQPPSQWLK